MERDKEALNRLACHAISYPFPVGCVIVAINDPGLVTVATTNPPGLLLAAISDLASLQVIPSVGFTVAAVCIGDLKSA